MNIAFGTTSLRSAGVLAALLAASCTLVACANHTSKTAKSARIDRISDEPARTGSAQAQRSNEQFFDPFAADVSAERGAPYMGVRVVSAANRTSSIKANPGNPSVYGDVGAPRTATLPDQDGAENLTQVSFASEGADFDPDVARDGKLIVYASTQHRSTADLYVKGVGARTITQLTSDSANDVMPSFSPDSKRVAFASDRSGSWDIYVMGIGGGPPVQLTDDPGQDLHPTWSPDGAKIAYCRLSTISGRWELWVVEVSNPAVQHFLGYGLFPRWSPVDDKILFQRSRERGDRLFSIWTLDYMNGEGSNPTEIVSSPATAAVNPTWSPDGRRIAFATIPTPLMESGERPDAADLWIVNADGGARANLTGGRSVNLMPSWASDGRIYFVSDRGGRDNIWSLIPEKAIIAASGLRANNLATVPTHDGEQEAPSGQPGHH